MWHASMLYEESRFLPYIFKQAVAMRKTNMYLSLGICWALRKRRYELTSYVHALVTAFLLINARPDDVYRARLTQDLLEAVGILNEDGIMSPKKKLVCETLTRVANESCQHMRSRSLLVLVRMLRHHGEGRKRWMRELEEEVKMIEEQEKNIGRDYANRGHAKTTKKDNKRRRQRKLRARLALERKPSASAKTEA